MSFILATLIYATYRGKVLMLHRHKEPNLNLWIAPGGKVDAHESPRECALRELREETGLQAENPQLRAIVTEISPVPDWQWLMFIYRVEVESSEIAGDLREGRLQWFDQEEVLHLPIPQADAIFYPLVMAPAGPPLELKFEYDADLRLIRWEKHVIGA
jgi:8-oxo-dGTP diphosphatase